MYLKIYTKKCTSPAATPVTEPRLIGLGDSHFGCWPHLCDGCAKLRNCILASCGGSCTCIYDARMGWDLLLVILNLGLSQHLIYWQHLAIGTHHVQTMRVPFSTVGKIAFAHAEVLALVERLSFPFLFTFHPLGIKLPFGKRRLALAFLQVSRCRSALLLHATTIASVFRSCGHGTSSFDSKFFDFQPSKLEVRCNPSRHPPSAESMPWAPQWLLAWGRFLLLLVASYHPISVKSSQHSPNYHHPSLNPRHHLPRPAGIVVLLRSDVIVRVVVWAPRILLLSLHAEDAMPSKEFGWACSVFFEHAHQGLTDFRVR